MYNIIMSIHRGKEGALGFVLKSRTKEVMRLMEREPLQVSMKKIPEEGNHQSDSSQEDIQFEESWEAWCLRHSSFEPGGSPASSKEPPSLFVISVCWFGVALSAIEAALQRW